jgi:hypothetical protein
VIHAFVAAAVLLVSAGEATGQRVKSRTQGLVLGAHLEGSSLVVEDSDRSNGGGGGAIVGWALGNGLGAFVQFDRTNVDVRNQPDVGGSWTISHLDIGARYHFANPARTAVPYVQAAYTLNRVTIEEIAVVSPTPTDELDLTGDALTVGGGVMLHVMPAFAFEFGLLFGFGSFNEAEFDGEPVENLPKIDLQSSRFNLGVVWWPLG